jgi:hypothetical protein
MTGNEPWECGGDAPALTLLEKIVIAIMMIISAVFFRTKK